MSHLPPYNYMNPQGTPSYPSGTLTAVYSSDLPSESQQRGATTSEADLYDWHVNVLAPPGIDPNLMNYYPAAAHRDQLSMPSNVHTRTPGGLAVMSSGVTPTVRQLQPQLRKSVAGESQDADSSLRTASGRAARKQRGRPRLDTKDENAADRRRTQIRLAQRAYRQRKESTISQLRDRVTELEGAMEMLNDIFLRIHSTALDCINNPYALDRQRQEFLNDESQRLRDQFLTVIQRSLKAKATSSDGESREGEDERERPDDAPITPRRRRRSGDDDGTGGPGPNNSSPTHSQNWRYTAGSSSASQGSTTSGTNDYGSQHSAHTYTLSPQSTQLDYPEKAEFNYHLHTYTFSRRLHKRCLETIYGFLTAPLTDAAVQAELQRIFVYTWVYRTREQVLEGVKSVLARYNLHGTHEAMCKAMSNTSYAYIDCDPACPPDTAAAQRRYYGPDDVQNHLVKLGAITRPVLRSVPEGTEDRALSCIPPDGDRGDGSGSISTLGSPLMYGRYYSPDSGVDDVDSWKPQKSRQPQTVVKVVQGISKAVDEEVLFQELLRRGVCLGKFPGWRQEDVDASLRIAQNAAQGYIEDRYDMMA